MPGSPANRRILDRAAVARLTGASRGTVDKWHREREHFGFPERAPGGGWYEDEIAAFWVAYQQARIRALAAVDRRGDPDELLASGAAARLLGYKTRNDLPDALLELADESVELPSGRIRRRWTRATLWNFADGYRGRQRTGRATGPRPNEAIDLRGEANEVVRSSEAARVLGYKHRSQLPQHVLDGADIIRVDTKGRIHRQWKRQTLWTMTTQVSQ